MKHFLKKKIAEVQRRQKEQPTLTSLPRYISNLIPLEPEKLVTESALVIIPNVDQQQLVPSQKLSSPSNLFYSGVDTASSLAVRKKGTCECGRGKMNASCRERLCVECCGANPNRCGVTTHQKAKARNFLSPFFALIDEAIQKKALIWIKYAGGTNPHSIRAVHPICWQEKKVFLLCQISWHRGKQHLFVAASGGCSP
jgi:hypothetical protein